MCLFICHIFVIKAQLLNHVSVAASISTLYSNAVTDTSTPCYLFISPYYFIMFLFFHIIKWYWFLMYTSPYLIFLPRLLSFGFHLPRQPVMQRQSLKRTQGSEIWPRFLIHSNQAWEMTRGHPICALNNPCPFFHPEQSGAPLGVPGLSQHDIVGQEKWVGTLNEGAALWQYS